MKYYSNMMDIKKIYIYIYFFDFILRYNFIFEMYFIIKYINYKYIEY